MCSILLILSLLILFETRFKCFERFVCVTRVFLLVAISSQEKVQKVLMPDLVPLLRAVLLWIVAGSEILPRAGIA